MTDKIQDLINGWRRQHLRSDYPEYIHLSPKDSIEFMKFFTGLYDYNDLEEEEKKWILEGKFPTNFEFCGVKLIFSINQTQIH